MFCVSGPWTFSGGKHPRCIERKRSKEFSVKQSGGGGKKSDIGDKKRNLVANQVYMNATGSWLLLIFHVELQHRHSNSHYYALVAPLVVRLTKLAC